VRFTGTSWTLFLYLSSVTQRDDEIHMRASLYIHVYIYIYICIRISFFFSTAGTAGRVGNLTTIRVHEYEECITGTGASKAAFLGYDARCVRREQWETNLSLISRMEILSCDAAMRQTATK